MISVVVPAYNEENGILKLLAHLKANSSGYVQEIIVVDGGSTDGTRKKVKSVPSIKLISSKKGRACQMNAGAKHAISPILYFLHADSFPPKHFDTYIEKKIKAGKKAGCFRMKFDKKHWWLTLMSWFTMVNHKSCRGGDQSLFIDTELFREMGGFNEDFIVFEDNEIIARLYARNQFSIINKWLVTSARLYERMGVWKTQWLFCQIYWKKQCGASPKKLYQHYKSKVSA